MTSSLSYHQAAEDNIPLISKEVLDPVSLLSIAHDRNAGAVVLFSGEVRAYNTGKEVLYLEYEAFEPMAVKMIAEILLEAKNRWTLNKAIAQHRTGKVMVGESAVIVITCSPHRKEAYQANRYIIDRIKHEVPIWKCEFFNDGTKEWGGNCSCEKITGTPNKHIYEFDSEKQSG